MPSLIILKYLFCRVRTNGSICAVIKIASSIKYEMAGRHDQEFERQLYKVPLGLRSPVNIHAFSSYQKKGFIYVASVYYLLF